MGSLWFERSGVDFCDVTPDSRFAWAGALIALGVISGALVSHLTVLGIVVKDDFGLLFGLAITS